MDARRSVRLVRSQSRTMRGQDMAKMRIQGFAGLHEYVAEKNGYSSMRDSITRSFTVIAVLRAPSPR